MSLFIPGFGRIMGSLRHPATADLVIPLRDKYNLKTCVETGTFFGNSTSWAAGHFETVVTIEIDQGYQSEALKRCQEYSNIQFVLGDSRTMLPSITKQLTEPALFWLDAHAVVRRSRPVPSQICSNPLLEEINIINQSEIQHIILVDDAHFWPDKSEIQSKAREGGYQFSVIQDIMILVPELRR
jgi:hypothetical protein